MGVKKGYKQTEVGVIPEDWETFLMASIADVRDGTHASQKYHKNGVPLVTSKNIVDGRVDFHEITLISEEDAYEVNRRSRVDRDDILVSMIGTVGNAALVDFEPQFCIKNVALIKPYKSKVEPRFLAQLLRSSCYGRYIDGKLDGGIQKFISLGMLRSLNVPLGRTIAEQEAIAEALSHADLLIESLEQLLAKKRNIKQGAMQELLTGKKRLPGFSGKWVVRGFGEIAQPRKQRVDPRRSGIHEFCIELEHIEQGTGCLSGFAATGEASSLKSVFQKDDVLFGKLRAYLQKYWFADREGVCSTEIWALTANLSLLVPPFLFQVVKMNRFIDAASEAYGTHMPRSDWNVVKNYEVLLPPIEEQTAIAAILADMDVEITTLETKLTKARQLKTGMMQELLTGRIRLI